MYKTTIIFLIIGLILLVGIGYGYAYLHYKEDGIGAYFKSVVNNLFEGEETTPNEPILNKTPKEKPIETNTQTITSQFTQPAYTKEQLNLKITQDNGMVIINSSLFNCIHKIPSVETKSIALKSEINPALYKIILSENKYEFNFSSLVGLTTNIKEITEEIICDKEPVINGCIADFGNVYFNLCDVNLDVFLNKSFDSKTGLTILNTKLTSDDNLKFAFRDPDFFIGNNSLGVFNNTAEAGGIFLQSDYELDLQFENSMKDIGKYGLSVSGSVPSYSTDDKGTGAGNFKNDANTVYYTTNNNLNQNTTNLTILFYINPSVAQSNNFEYLLYKITTSANTAGGYYLVFANNTGKIYFYYANGSIIFSESSSGIIKLNKWGCYGLTLDNISKELRYFNGSLTSPEQDTLDTSAIFSSALNIYVGSSNGGTQDVEGNLSRLMLAYRWFSDQEAYDWCQSAHGVIENESGTYTSQVFALNQSIDINHVNYTIDSYVCEGCSIDGSVRTKTVNNSLNANGLLEYEYSLENSGLDTFSGSVTAGSVSYIENVYNGITENYVVIDFSDTITYTLGNKLNLTSNDCNWGFLIIANRTANLGSSDLWVSTIGSNYGFYFAGGASNMSMLTYNGSKSASEGINVFNWDVNTTRCFGFTANGAAYNYYVDGVNIGSDDEEEYTDTNCMKMGGNNLVIGGADSQVNIGRLGFFNYTLTQSQILAWCNNTDTYIENDYQPITNGVDMNNFSLVQNPSFAQFKNKLVSNGTDTPIIKSFNGTFFNYTAPAGADTTPPYITVAPANITTTNQSLLWNVTFNEASNMSGTYGVCPTYVTSYFENDSRLTTLTYYNGTLINSTTYCYNLTNFCDVSNNCNTTGYLFNFSTIANAVDTTPPTWSNNQIELNEAGSISYFNITWTDETGFNNAIFESNYSGSVANYSMNNITSDVYNYSAIISSDGIYYWKSFGNDTSNNLNVSDTWVFTVGCVPTWANTSWTSYINISVCYTNDTIYQMSNLTQYDSTGCNTTNTTFYNYTFETCNYCSYNVANTSWTAELNISCQITDNMTVMRNLTEYDSNYSTCYAITSIATDLWNSGNNITYYNYTNISSCDYCSYDLANTSLTWIANGTCNTSDQHNLTYNYTTYDQNYSTCFAITNIQADNYTNTTYSTYYYNGTCNYCSYNVANTSWTAELNLTCQITDNMTVMRNLTEYDSNYSTCYAITSIATDLWNSGNNITYYNYTNISSCNYCSYDLTNTSWFYSNNNTCYLNDTMNQTYNKTEYDQNYSVCYAITGIATDLWNSGNNNTYQTYIFNETCNYCSYNIANTSWTSWLNITCLSNNTMNQSSNLTEYDSNYSTCYAVTSIATDLWNGGVNNTYYQYNTSLSCNYLGCPNITSIINTSTNNESSYIQFNASESVNYSIYVTSWLNNNTFALFHNTYWDTLSNFTSYTVNLTVTDDYGCSVSNNTFSFTTVQNIDATPPIITLDSPLNNSWTNNATVTFQYTPTDTNLDSCSLYHNATTWAINYTNSTPTSGSQDSYTVTLFENDFLWNVWCNDTSGNSAFNLTNFTVMVDTTPPTPCDSGNIYYGASYGSGFEYTCNSEDNRSGIYNYFLINETGNFSINASGFVTNITNLQPNVWYLNVSVNDSAGNINSVLWTINISDTSTPALDILYPTNTYYQNLYWINLSIRDDFPNNITINDSRWVRNISNSSYASFYNGSEQPEGNYTIAITYNDTWGNTGYYNLSFVIDRTSPFTSLVSPPNKSSWTTSLKVTFVWNVTDTNPIDQCYIDIDSPVGGYGSSVFSPTYNYSKVLSNAEWEWSINCTDEAGNWNATNKWNVTVNYASGINVTLCRYKKLGYYNTQLPWLWEVNCI